MIKKVAFAIFILTSVPAMAAAGSSSLNPAGNNGTKEQSGNSSDKDNNKYTFTLFNFFTAAESSVKSDTLQIEPKRGAEKGVKDSN